MTDKERAHIVSFENESGTSVTARITRGLTIPFRDHAPALSYARELRSYVYPLFCKVALPGKGSKSIQYGYAVPK